MADADTLTARQVGVRSESAKMGKNEAIERLKKLGIIHPAKVNGPNTQLGLKERVLMYLCNTNQNIFSHRAKRRQALAIVDACIESFLEAKSSDSDS